MKHISSEIDKSTINEKLNLQTTSLTNLENSHLVFFSSF
jgi:hypothetical protein